MRYNHTGLDILVEHKIDGMTQCPRQSNSAPPEITWNARNCFFALRGECTEEPVWEEEKGEAHVLERLPLRSGRFSHINPRR
jgi:hypothetical protein